MTPAEGERFEAWAAESLAGKKLQIAYWAIAIEPSQASPHAARLCWNNDFRLLEGEVGSGEREEDVIARSWSDLVREDELARRGEASDDPLYVGFVLDGDCILGE